MTLALFILCLLLIIILFYKQIKEMRTARKNDYSQKINRILFTHIDAYILLIDRNFMVEQTNYYMLNKSQDTGKPKRVGDLLRCVNAVESGECGTHENCNHCPIRAAIDKTFDSNENFRHLETTVLLQLTESQKPLSCDVSISGIYFQNIDREPKVLLTVYDITSLKNVEKELVIAKERAESSEKMKAAFLANMSHEIRTPLNAILGFSDILAISEKEEERKNYQNIIRQNGEHLMQLINDILDLSKMEAGMMKFTDSEIDLNELITGLQKSFQYKTTHLPIICDLPEKGAVISVAVQRLRQVFINLLSNAVKFTPKGSIHIGYEIRPYELYFYVKDSGKGIPTEELPNVFKRFVKLDTNVQGTGLGLSICQMIVDRFNGRLGVDSKVGEGSTFWFTIPANKKGPKGG